MTGLRARFYANIVCVLLASGAGEMARGFDVLVRSTSPADSVLMFRKFRGADEVGDRDQGGGDRGSGRGDSSKSQPHGSSAGGKDNTKSEGGNTKSGEKSNANDGNDRFSN